MATKKIYDLAVKTGSYTRTDGEEKSRYLNIGMIMQKDDGGKFLIMNRTVNLAGVPNPENKDTLIVSMFAADKKESEPEQPAADNNDPDFIPF